MAALAVDAAAPSSATSPGGRLDAGCSIARASVDLPQPDSPTTPRISPLRQSSETPSTARADQPLRRGTRPPRSRTSISGPRSSGRPRLHGRRGRRDLGPLAPRREVAGGRVAPRRPRAAPGPRPAALVRVRAARLEATARRAARPDRAARRDRGGEPAAAADHGQRLEQALRVRVLGVVEDRADRPDLDDPARVHDRDPVAGLGEHAEVVGDQDQRQARAARAGARAAAAPAPA